MKYFKTTTFCIFFALLLWPAIGLSQSQVLRGNNSNLNQGTPPVVNNLAPRGVVNPGLFKPSAIISMEVSKKLLKKYYREGNHNITLHCGCQFDKQLQVFPSICQHQPQGAVKKQKKEIIEWVHLIPASIFAGGLRCWRPSSCATEKTEDGGGEDCCRQMSPKFQKMQADMHNIFPAITVVEDDDAKPKTLRFGGQEEYRFCSLKEQPAEEPRSGVLGDIARAYFYMSHQYKIAIPDAREDQLRAWHLKDPPDAWEERRNSLIELDQGNRNPFIDHPELVERVRDF